MPGNVNRDTPVGTPTGMLTAAGQVDGVTNRGQRFIPGLRTQLLSPRSIPTSALFGVGGAPNVPGTNRPAPRRTGLGLLPAPSEPNTRGGTLFVPGRAERLAKARGLTKEPEPQPAPPAEAPVDVDPLAPPDDPINSIQPFFGDVSEDTPNLFDAFRSSVQETMNKFVGLDLEADYIKEIFQGQDPQAFFDNFSSIFEQSLSLNRDRPSALQALKASITANSGG